MRHNYAGMVVMISPFQFLVRRLTPRAKRLNPVRTKLTKEQCLDLKLTILGRLISEDYTCRLPKPKPNVRHKLRKYGVYSGICYRVVWK